jgi:hypothetical protein
MNINPISDPEDILRGAGAEKTQDYQVDYISEGGNLLKDSQITPNSGNVYRNTPIVDHYGEVEVKQFSYKLPMSNYVLGWMYILLAISAGYSLFVAGVVTAQLVGLNINNIANEGNSLSVLLPKFAVMLGAVLISVMLLNTFRFSRVIALILSFGLAANGLYELVGQAQSLSAVTSNAGIFLINTWSLLPFVVLPVISFLYLIGAKAGFVNKK